MQSRMVCLSYCIPTKQTKIYLIKSHHNSAVIIIYSSNISSRSWGITICHSSRYTFGWWKAAFAVMAYWHAVDKHVASPPVDQRSGWSIYLRMLKIRLETVRVECVQHTYTDDCPWNQGTIQSHYLSTTLISAKGFECQTITLVFLFGLLKPLGEKQIKWRTQYNSLMVIVYCVQNM